jgi:hypothetical protein
MDSGIQNSTKVRKIQEILLKNPTRVFKKDDQWLWNTVDLLFEIHYKAAIIVNRLQSIFIAFSCVSLRHAYRLKHD